jgi:hypothetical protein
MPSTRRSFIYWGTVAAMAVAAHAACAQSSGKPLIDPGRIIGGSTKQLRDVQPVAGFLPNVSLLRPGGPGQAAFVYINPSVNFGSYGKVVLDPVSIWTARGSALSGVPLQQRRAVANSFYSRVFNALKKRCEMVRAAEPGAMRVRIALTDATTPNAAVNTVATYAPYVSTAYAVASFAFNKGVGYFAGSAAAEGYATDATTGTLLWQAVDKRAGTTALVANTLNNWRDVENAFDAWSEQLASRIQEVGACRR